jgi:hypothetical protein
MRKAPIVAAVAIVFLIPALYLASPLSKSTRSLRVFVNRETFAPSSTGYRAIIVNDGYLPIFVYTCEGVEDTMPHLVVVPDVIQRWQPEHGSWNPALERKGCHKPPEGTREKKLTLKLVWPGQKLYSSYFFPNIGFPGFPFKHGDKLRFLVFTRTSKQRGVLSSPEFTIN